MAHAPSAPRDDHPQLVRLEERQLLVRHSDGDPDAFAELVRCYRAPVYGCLVRCGVDPHARDDVFQEIFLRIHKAAASYRADLPLHPWVFTIVANTVRSHYRKLRVRRLVFSEEKPPAKENESGEPDGREVVEARETAARVDAALRRLPGSQREVVLLCCVENLSQAEVSDALGIAPATVRTRLARGRAAIAASLATRRSQREWLSDREASE